MEKGRNFLVVSGNGVDNMMALAHLGPFTAALGALDGAMGDLLAEEHSWEGVDPVFRDPAETAVPFDDPFLEEDDEDEDPDGFRPVSSRWVPAGVKDPTLTFSQHRRNVSPA